MPAQHPGPRRWFVPDNPVPKGRARTTTSGHTYTPTRTLQAEWRIRQHVSERLTEPVLGPLTLRLVVWLKPPRSTPRKWIGVLRPSKRPDIDNYLKTVMDALNGIAYADDSQIVRCVVEKRYAWEPTQPAGWDIRIS